MPSQEELRRLFEYKDGELINRTARPHSPKGAAIGSLSHRYKVAYVNYKCLRVHRMIWVYFNGDIPDGYEIDHLNHDRADNRIENLRLVTHRENTLNVPKYRTSKAKRVGVHWYEPSKKYRARITINGKDRHLGFFDSLGDAMAVRESVEKQFGFHPNHGTVN